MVYLDHKTNCVFTVKQSPGSSFIKHFEVMEQQGKCGPKSDFLSWFYCFFVNKENV